MNAAASHIASCLAAQQSAETRHLHEIEAEDVTISQEALTVIRQAAQKLLSRYSPVDSLRLLTLGDAVALFSSRMFWNEENGKLFMCSQLADGALCLPIPEGHWRVRQDHPQQ